jgi:cytochrome P450
MWMAADDIEVGGQYVKKGGCLIAWIVSGNRGETVFENSLQFDIQRMPATCCAPAAPWPASSSRRPAPPRSAGT